MNSKDWINDPDEESEEEKNEPEKGSEATFQKLLERRIIWLGEEVTNQNANLICAKMLLLSEEDPDKDITLYINSPGGSISDGLSIYDVMQFVKPDVITVGIGLAASMGQFLLSSGTKGKRFAFPHTRIMMHQPTGGIYGKVTDVSVTVKEIAYLKKMLSELIAEQTGQTLEKILNDVEKHDVWFTAQEALKYGFIDHIVQTSADLPIGDKSEKN
ncbi:MAG: ATP-dependent Clp protease proteolytic subunit [Bifidobacteriaceae bacterium]|jgi:ATP-dependent Clp protease protease subunit|nr:ATP-dependent Clp protease proteolytic subunit [Bifidobacteriaceae bacterium]